MSTYLGWTVIDIPSAPAVPKSIERQYVPIVAANTSPFSGQQQIQQWSTGYFEVSVSYQPMNYSVAQPWVTFLNDLQGMSCVFQFGSTACTAFPLELTTDGTTPAYWRLKTNSSKWTINEGKVYAFTFELRQAL